MKRIALAVLLSGVVTHAAAAQAGWTAQLVLSPLPSPFLSDWEVDPGIGQLVVTNGTSATNEITFHYTLTRSGQLLLRGVTDPQTVPAGQAVTFDATSTFGGRADWDRGVQDQMARTGRLPEGEFEACVTITDPGGLVLVPRQCVRFSTLYPDPPSLVFPLNGDTVTTQDPIFEWLPVQLPPQADGRIGYVLQIAEVNTAARQRPEVALESNILHYLEPDLLETSHAYPLGALPLAPGRTYAWRVQALDGDGRPVAANQGRSEVWTFVYREPEAEVHRAVASIALTPRRDTLRYVGDTARYDVRAYDADNVEIPGKRAAWRSLDTTVVRVDTLGVVTGVAAGETRIVATVDGVADSALSVTAVPTGLTVGFERFDASTDQPSLLELVRSGSYDDVVPKLMELLQSGQLRIPIPRLPGVPGQQDDVSSLDDLGPLDRGNGASGPHPGLSRPRSTSDETCGTMRVPAEAATDRDRQVWVVPFRLRGGDAESVQRHCFQVDLDSVVVVDSTPYCDRPGPRPNDSTHTGCPPGRRRWDLDSTLVVDTTTTVDTTTVGADVALFGVSWATGLPRVFIMLKPPGDEFAIPGTSLRSRYWVFNLLRSGEVSSAMLPPAYAGFFGDESFDVGVGLTLHIKRQCGASDFCEAVRWFYRNANPDVTIHAFAGVTAAELSYGTGGRGSATALGFNIQASLPVRVWGVGFEGLRLDSTQAGVIFAVQDSVENPRTTRTHNWSIGIAAALTVWWSGPHNAWEASGSIGHEWDPKNHTRKIVISGQLEQVWKFWWFRIGNPQIVFTRTLGQDLPETTLEVSGSWGAGAWDGNPNEAVGLVDGGGDQRGDIGGAASGGGLEEMGRALVKVIWTKQPAGPGSPPSPTGPITREQAERQDHYAADSLAKWERIAADLKDAAEQDESREQEWRAANQRVIEWRAVVQSQQPLGAGSGPAGGVRDQPARTASPQPPPPSQCQSLHNGWCRTWSVRVSVGPTSLVDFFATLGRLGVAAVAQ
jgi:hypothetical protein